MSQPCRILVVDDEEGILRVARIGLEHHGYQVLTASGGLDALEVLEVDGDSLSLVILDLVMPDLPGKTVFARLRRRSQLPVLFTSGFRGSDSIAAELAEPHTAFLPKPWTLGQHAAAVADILAR